MLPQHAKAKWFKVERTDESPANMPVYFVAFKSCDVKNWLSHGKHGDIVECSHEEAITAGAVDLCPM